MTARLLSLISAASFLGSTLVLGMGIASAAGTGLMGSGAAMLGFVVLGGVALRTRALAKEIESEAADRRDREALLQNELAAQRQAIDVLADGLDLALFMCDSRGNIGYANRRAVELFEHEDAAGKSVLTVTLSYDLELLVKKAAETGEDQRREITFTYPRERVGLAQAWTSVPGDRTFLSIYDITDLRRLERIRQDFVANVSHELRTPMTVIRAYAETLLDEEPPNRETMARYLPRIISEVDRLSSITQDLLILSAAESNPVRKQTCDFAEVLQSVVSQLSLKAQDKGLELDYVGPQKLYIQANSAQMIQVALNVVDNAINYTNEGGVSVLLSVGQSEVTVAVKDTGVGIASEHVGRIFERFYRVDKSRSRVTGGTGLGLSIVKHIVEAHGGTVTVESALNQGSTFTLTLPIGDVGEA